ncbi:MULTISPECIES: sulfotransferase family protein [unclassified Coleofasciculus]|uniref:sulfotransferase family protein n=1 Tax=unclassified Coleofasciculus TaxID=2692782 RepID=UPI001880F514|nr:MULTISPECIES: sulfotransferase [unclassified Coleofasciculus]MBE9127945.1 sulfotransferase [Coleofasciculus sp. LEGE 07081]MBE9151105.1 sulfotransferase [Coleofasciculus sp. LEGE 07092]
MELNFFVLGCERGGTTLLCALLSEHPEVFCLNDSFLFDIYVRQKGRKGHVGISSFWKNAFLDLSRPLPSKDYLVSLDEVEEYFSNLLERYEKPNPAQNKSTWLKVYSDTLKSSNFLNEARSSNLTLTKMFSSIYSYLIPREQQTKKIFGEKTPRHLYLSKWISTLYPKAKFIVLVRNPLTNVAALYKRRKSLKLSIDTYLSYYNRSFISLYEGEENLVIRYEDLVSKPQDTLLHVYEYLGANSEEVSTEFNYFIKQGYIGNTIDPERDVKLKEMLNEQEKKLIKKRCQYVFNKFYPNELS